MTRGKFDVEEDDGCEVMQWSLDAVMSKAG